MRRALRTADPSAESVSWDRRWRVMEPASHDYFLDTVTDLEEIWEYVAADNLDEADRAREHILRTSQFGVPHPSFAWFAKESGDFDSRITPKTPALRPTTRLEQRGQVQWDTDSEINPAVVVHHRRTGRK